MSILSGIWKTSDVDPSEIVLQEFQEKEELKCDPLYLAVKLGSVHLLHQRLFREHQEKISQLTQEDKVIPQLKAIKISLKEDSNIKIEEPKFTQGLERRLYGEGRIELGLIRRHLIKLLRWFDYESPNYKTILKACKKGIKIILDGYKYHESQEILISLKPSLKQIVPNFTIKTSQDDPIISKLEADILLLKKALKVKDERQQLEFNEELIEEEKKFFHFSQNLMLIESGKTINDYMLEKVQSKWDERTLKSIVESFDAAPSENFDHYNSISSLIKDFPSTHQNLKMKVRELISNTFSNYYNVTVLTSK